MTKSSAFNFITSRTNIFSYFKTKRTEIVKYNYFYQMLRETIISYGRKKKSVIS